MARTMHANSERVNMMGKPLYMYLDEAGDFNFGERGSSYYVLACVLVHRPFGCASELDSLRLDALEDGVDIEYFHACNDRRWLRNRVFDVIGSHANEFAMFYAAVKKAGNEGELSDVGTMYCELFDQLTRLVTTRYDLSTTNRVIAITDNLPVEVKRKQYKLRMRSMLSTKAPSFTIVHHHSMSDRNLQLADYCCWAVQRKLERDDSEWMERISPAMRSGISIERVHNISRKRQGPPDMPMALATSPAIPQGEICQQGFFSPGRNLFNESLPHEGGWQTAFSGSSASQRQTQ